MIVAERDGTVLRYARKEDMPRVDEITVLCYRGILESYVRMLGEQCYQAVRHDPHLTWEERKTGQVHSLFSEHPDWVWVLEQKAEMLTQVSTTPAMGLLFYFGMSLLFGKELELL